MKIIHVEGPDGVGKSTLCRKAADELMLDTDVLSFPTVVPTVDFEDTYEETYWYLEDMRKAFARTLRDDPPEVLLLDRSFVSTAVYQGSKELPSDFILKEGLSHYEGGCFDDPTPGFLFMYGDPELCALRSSDDDAVGKMTLERRAAKISDLQTQYKALHKKLDDIHRVRSVDIPSDQTFQEIGTLIRNLDRDETHRDAS